MSPPIDKIIGREAKQIVKYRFFPYGSYIDARSYEPEDLAAFMAEKISNPDEYRAFFEWKKLYRYRTPSHHLCRICAALHNRTKFEAYSVHQDFQSWWHPDYEERCEDTTWN